MNNGNELNRLSRHSQESLGRSESALVPVYALPDGLIGESSGFQPSSENRGIAELLGTLRRRKWLIILLALTGAVVGTLLTLTQVPVYQAQTTLLMQSGNDGLLSLRPGDSTSTADYSNASYIQTQINIILSRTFRRRVLEKANTVGRTAQPPLLQVYLGRIGLSQAANRMRTDVASISNIQVTPVDSRILAISCDANDPELAAECADMAASEYIDYTLESHTKALQHALGWLNQQLEELGSKLKTSEKEAQDFTRTSGLIFADEHQSLANAKLQQIQTQLTTAESNRIQLESAYETAANVVRSGGSTPGGQQDELRSRLTEVNRELARLSARYSPAYPKVKDLQLQADYLNSALESERTDVLQKLSANLEAAKKLEKMLRVEYGRQSSVVLAQNREAIQYNLLRHDADINRNIYEVMLQKVKQLDIASAMPGSTAMVIDSAVSPTHFYKPSLFLDPALGLVAGILLAVMMSLGWESLDQTFRLPGGAGAYLGLPELGAIPAGDSNRKSRLWGKSANPINLNRNGSAPAANGEECVELVTMQHKLSPIAESFRASLASILFSRKDSGGPRVIAVTSPGSGDGKTAVSSNLALALAEIYKRVLIIDADMRRPRLHKIYGMENTWGLKDLLSEGTSLDNVPLEALVRESRIPNLSVLTSGPGTICVSSLLYGSRLADLIRRFRTEFDAVIIDTAPAQQVSDARIIGRLADGVILVLRAGITQRSAAMSTRQRLLDDNIPILGTVLNDWNPRDSNREYYYSYDRQTQS